MVHVVAMNAYGEVLGHLTAFHGFDTYRFECVAEIDQRLVVVEFAPEGKASCPGKDRSDRVGGSGFTLLVIAVVACYGAMGSFGLHCLPIGGYEHRGHQAQ